MSENTANKIPFLNNNIIMRSVVPSMRYDGTKPFEVWQKEAREKLSELLGLDKFQSCSPDFNIEYKKELDNATEIRFTYKSEENYTVPCHLLIPKGAKGKLPVVICLQGHSTGAHISLGRIKYNYDEDKLIHGFGDRDFAVRILEEGYIALTVEQRNFGECGAKEDGLPNCEDSSLAALLVGRTTIGERVWDIKCVIDILETEFSDVYNGYCMCMGNSAGGTATFYAACIDERIKAAMPSCALCTYEDSIGSMTHCTCNYIPHIREYFDMGDLGGLIAPRKYVIVSGKDDKIFPIEHAKKTYEITKSLYDLLGAEDSCRHVIGDGGHRFYADDAWPVMNELVKGDF